MPYGATGGRYVNTQALDISLENTLRSIAYYYFLSKYPFFQLNDLAAKEKLFF